MDGKLNNGNKLGKEFERNRTLVASIAFNWAENVPEQTDASAFESFRRSVHRVGDLVNNDAMYKARLNTLSGICSRLESDLEKIHAQAVSQNPDRAEVDRLLNSAANTMKELKDEYSVFRRNYADETKHIEAFSDFDKLLTKTKFTTGKDILDLASANQNHPGMQQVPPINLQNDNNQNIINQNINNQNIINGQPVIQADQQVPPVQPNPQGQNNLPQDPNNAAVRLLSHIANLKNTMNSDAEQGNITYEQLVRRQAEIHLLERIYNSDPNFWISNAPKALQTLNNEILPNTYNQKRQGQIATYEERVRNVYDLLNLKKDRPVPDALKKYYENVHQNPLNAQNAVAIKESVLDTDPDAIDLYDDDPTGGFSEKLLDAIAADLKFERGNVLSPERNSLTEYFSSTLAAQEGGEHAAIVNEINEYLARTHFIPEREITVSSQFIVYLIGRPQNAYSYEEACKIVPGHPDFKKEVKAFHDFLKENVTEGAAIRDGENKITGYNAMDPDKARAGAHAWAAVFHKAADALNQYTFPDIDYTDPTQINAHLHEFADLSAIGIDFGQNLGPFLSHTKPEYLDDVPLGREALSKRADTPTLLTNTLSTLKAGYNFNSLANNLNPGNRATERALRKVASARIVWGLTANDRYRNKSIGNLLESNNTVKDLVADQVSQVFSPTLAGDRNVSKKMALDYLKGNGQEYQQYVLNNWDEQLNTVRIETFNEEQIGHAHQAQLAIKSAAVLPGFKQKCREIYAPGRSGEDIYADLIKQENREISNQGSSVLQHLLERGYQRDFLAYVKDPADPINLIKINGKTMEECWGEKYAFLQDPEQKKIAYRAELMNEAMNGSSEITFDSYGITKDYRIAKNVSTTIVDSPKSMEEKRRFLRSVRDLHQSVESIIRDTNAYDPRPENQQFYDAMKAAAKKCLDHSLLSNLAACNYPSLKEELQEFANLATQFYAAEEAYYNGVNRGDDATKAKTAGKQILDTLAAKQDAMDVYAKTLHVTPNPEFEKRASDVARYSFGAMKAHLDDSSLIRFGKELDLEHSVVSFEGELEWLNHLSEEEEEYNLAQDKYDLLDQKMDFHIGSPYLLDRIASGTQIKNLPGFNDNLMTNDPARIHSLFVIWAMAKKGLTVEEAVTLSEGPKVGNNGQALNADTLQRNEQYRTEFLNFAIAHPMTKPQGATEASEKERIKGWSDVFREARTKLEDYRLPDINYEDVDQVRTHIKPLLEIRGLSVDAVQEWNKFQKTFDSYPEIVKGMGTEKELDSNRQFYLNLQNVGLSIMGGYVIAGDGALQTDKICQVIEQRYETGKMMMSHRGKTLKEYLDAKKTTILSEDVYLEKLENLRTNPEFGPDVKLTLGYALGANGNAFDEKMDKMRREADIRWRKEMTENQKKHFAAFREGCLKDPEVRKLVLASGDDAQSMKNLFSQELTDKRNGRTVGEYVLRVINGELTQDYQGGVLTVLGENKSKLFLIDKRSPEELWGDKYNDLPADEKEFMLRLEVAKCIAKGDKTVMMRQFGLESDGREDHLKETANATVFLPKEQLQQTLDGALNYMGEKERFLSELKVIRSYLISTQDKDKKDRNFFSTDVTGSTSYQNMCIILQNTIALLEKDGTSEGDNITPDRIRRNLIALEQVSDFYYKDHYGTFFRPITNNGTVRLNMSEKMKTGLLDRFDRMRQWIDKDLVAKEGSFRNVSSYEAKRQAMRMVSTAGLMARGDDFYFNSVIKKELHEKLLILKESDSVRNMERDPQPLALAKAYLIGMFETYDAAPVEGVGAKKQNPNMIRMIELFDQRALYLSQDPVFLKMMTENREDCINRWQEIEKRALDLQEEYAREWNRFSTESPDAAHYVFGIRNADKENGVTIQGKLAENAADPEFDDLLTAFYDNAGKVIVIQLLAEENNSRADLYREQIAADPNRFDALVVAATAYLRNQNAITVNNLPQFISKINDEKYKTSFFKYLENREKEALGQKETEIRNTQNTSLNNISFLIRDYEGQAVSAQQHAMADQVLHLTDIRGVMSKHEMASRYLNAPMTAMNGQGVQVTITPDLNVYSHCNLGTQRLASLHGPIILYAMSEKNLSLDEAINLVLTVKVLNEQGDQVNVDEFNRAQQLRYDFYNFCKDHPVQDPNLTAQQLTDNFKAWAKVYRDGSARFMQNRLLNINYRDESSVNRNLDKIGMVYRVIIDVDQELTRLFNESAKGVSGQNVVKEACGGEKAFYEIKNNWWNLSSKMSYFEHGYADAEELRQEAVTVQGQNMEHFRNKILDLAVLRCLAKQEMNQNAGKTFDEIAHLNQAQLLIQKDLVNSIKGAATDYFNDEGVYLEGASPEDAINYLLGIHTEKFEKAVNRLVVQETERSKESRYKRQISNAVLFRDTHFSMDDEGLNKLLEMQEDADSMKNFLTAKIDPENAQSPTGEAWLSDKAGKMQDGLFNQEASEICNVAGMNPSDLIRIEGRSPEELWGEKYASVRDYELKEKLYRLEIIKEIAKGEHDISLRLFKLGVSSLEETKPMLFVPKRENLKNLADGLHIYEAGKNEFQLELNGLKTKLTASQDNPLANFTDGQDPEGIETYRTMTNGLKNLLKCFEKDYDGAANITVQNFLESFDYTLEAAKEYERRHSGEKEANLKPRMDVCRKLIEVLPRMKESYIRMRKGFESDLAAQGQQTLKDGTYYRIKHSITALQAVFNIPSETELTYQNRFICEDIKCRLDVIKNRPLSADAETRENELLAREYLDHYYRTKADDGLITNNELRAFDDTYKARFDALKGDSIFLDLMKKHGVEKVAGFWNEAEAISAQMKQEAENSLQNTKESYLTYSRYISRDPSHRDNRTIEELDRDAIARIKAIVEDEGDVGVRVVDADECYKRLADILVRQIMSKDTPVGNSLRSAIAVQGGPETAHGKQERETIVNNFIRILKAYEVLKPGNVGRAMKQLESGRLAVDMEREYEYNRIWNEEQRKQNLINNPPQEDFKRSFSEFIKNDILDDGGNILNNQQLRTRDDDSEDEEEELINDNNLINNDINENDIDNAFGQNQNAGLLDDDDSLDEEQNIINTNRLPKAKPQNPGEVDYDSLYERCLDKDRFKQYNDPNNIMNDNEEGDVYGISKEQLTAYMKGVPNAFAQLKSLDREEKYENGENAQELAELKGKYFIQAVTAQMLFTGKIRIRPHETIKKLEERVILGYAANSKKPEDRAKRMDALKYLLENTSGERLHDYAKTGTFDDVMFDAQTRVHSNTANKKNANINDLNKGQKKGGNGQEHKPGGNEKGHPMGGN